MTRLILGRKFCETTDNVTTSGSPPQSYKARTALNCRPWLKDEKRVQCARALHYDNDYNDDNQREKEVRRRQVTQETTTTGVATTMVCHCVCDHHHYSLEEEERLTTMVTSIGEKAQGEGRPYDTTTRKTVVITAMQDRLQERFERKRTTTSSDYIIRLPDRLLRLGAKISDCFSHGSRAGTTTRRDNMTTRVATAAACNGTDYNNCDVSTTATPTSSETESTTSTSTDYSITPTSCADYDTVDLINPLSNDCTHYIMMLVGPSRKSKRATTTSSTCCQSSSRSRCCSSSTTATTTSHATSRSLTTTYCV